MKLVNWFGVATAAMLLTTPVYGQSADSRLAAEDRAFLEKAAQGNMAEIETGKLAQRKATRSDIKRFGQEMERDHGKTLKELQALAKSKGVRLPQELDGAHKAQARQLDMAKGADFDKTYVMHAGVANHKAAKELFEKGAKSKDPDISAFAKKVLPHIEDHLAKAQQMAENS